MSDTLVDLSHSPRPVGATLETTLELARPESRLRIRLPPGKAGRAEALLADGQRWAAKHHWQATPDEVIYEFDGPLPEGAVRLQIPFAPR